MQSSTKDDVSHSAIEERCQELIVIARRWEEQLGDLRNFSQMEKEALEGEISCLLQGGAQKDKDIQSLENSLMTLEDERVRNCAINDLNVQSKIEIEVKLQLMESALEAVSLSSKQDSHLAPPVKKVDCGTSTADITPGAEENPNEDSSERPQVDNVPVPASNDLDSEKIALQLEVRKLRHQLIVSKISAKQFKSECNLYKENSRGNYFTKKRKNFCPSPSSKGPSKQCSRLDTPTYSRTLQNIENKSRCDPSGEMLKHKKKEYRARGEITQGVGRNVAYSVSMVDGEDMCRNICLRM